ncbi:MAG: hydrogenase expression/formation protein HypE [Proteobacteria bacterium]|nr:hydrogenase expression/formation protein HypE [Pseudomonadota bacterium]MBU1386498.1 hydrogenase expression/formation protein HypE [Pseudomonadota bacterium]MBU1544609.1 hydrogenase expression/formation protein HypE [Pseudomonadota bacterium]MBU2430381.1 hydrogenase expression/formation protein HypE [Pseudomonadota bacterium]MBU2481412.1 hydrogenase expression/formation protein HypE [Pseudomonadota bacterium]
MNTEKILLDHGSGGKISHALFADLILPLFDNPELSCQDDGAILDFEPGRLAFSTDSYVVDPIFFPGGNIGDLAVNGTINDIAMCGAVPKVISAGLILEEGFLLKDLKIILESMASGAKKAGVKIVTGDTKVVPKGKADKIFINTSGIGILPSGIHVSGNNAKPGDQIILSGTLADHGIAVLTAREGLSFESDIQTDSAALNTMTRQIIESGCDVHVFRDPTRGGLGTTLNEIAVQSKVGIKIYEPSLPIKGSVQGVCELLGFDPLYIANEGKLICFTSKQDAQKTLEIIQKNEFGKDAAIIGEVTHTDPGVVLLQTAIGGVRLVDMLTGEQLPRIC